MIAKVNYIRNGIKDILFPRVCEICGHQLSQASAYVCESCLNSRFEVASGNQQGFLLPKGIEFQFSMWKFDKGGYLQDLLHSLKYHQLRGVGVDLGKQLGNEIIKKTTLKKESNVLVIPVPLHINREKKRGFNQARVIGEGVKKSTEFPLIEKGVVTRIKDTKTQTGFALKKRNENIQNAFIISEPDKLKGQSCMIIDDVFTTGATTFELAKSLKKVGVKKIFVVTVACA